MGVLYVVATPIGNLEDITRRALRVLEEVDVIAAEDTRVTRKLLAHFGLQTPLISCHAHTSEGKRSALIERLVSGEAIALVSDAGTPCLSDPGQELIAQAAAAGVRIEPIPGPSALLAGLVGSALPWNRFVFEGFLPRTNDRRERLELLARESRAIVLYEASPRLTETLGELARFLGEQRQACVGRELTKKFEEFQRGSLAWLLEHYARNPPRGECVIVIAPGVSPAQELSRPDPKATLVALLQSGLSVKEASRQAAMTLNMGRKELYALALTLNTTSEP